MHLPVYIATTDPRIVIVDREDHPVKRITYLDLETGERWVEIGVCNQCGLCEIGSANEESLWWDPTKKRGEPFSCSDPTYATRLEVVNRPSIKEAMRAMARDLGIEGGGCSYDFEVLEPLEK